MANLPRIIALCIMLLPASSALSPQMNNARQSKQMTRGQFFWNSVAAGAFLAAPASKPVLAAEPAKKAEKKLNLSDDELKDIVLSDLLDRHFLVSGDLTRAVYDESATFTDEIDTYGLEQWMKGTQRLFVAEGSDFNLVGDVQVDSSRVEFKFDEKLMFRIPFNPVVSLTGKVILTRDASNGLITSYREYWDQDVGAVLRTAKFKI
mmetsp:Transcript_5850/g.8277  ORF Transcript_5850/g.8277 Transcript_5850/m.8277 type:complete len:206 (-) Transcript_5850:215-832(-)